MAYGANGKNGSNGAPRIPEFKLKEQMCDIGRRIWQKGFCAGNEGNHSYRIGPDRVLCTPTGISKSTLKPDDICTVDMEGKQVAGKRKRTSEILMHLAIYKARPDVKAVVHSHSPSVIPFGVARTPLRPIYHMGSFLWSGAPVFDIRREREDNDLLVRDRPLGRALAASLGNCTCVLMRGHGSTTVGKSIEQAVFRAIYAEMNAKLQLAAIGLGEVTYLNDKEAQLSSDMNDGQIARSWDLWVRRIGKIG